jgi:6,7-dimethyl-8-ribityllumazine synthase
MAPKILIVASCFNEMITKALVEGAEETLNQHDIPATNRKLIWVPGAFELPIVAARAARSGLWDAIICLGCVIRGDTPHFDYVAGETARGVMEVMLETEVPVIFGVLTTDNTQQALERSSHSKKGNKGKESSLAALAMIGAMRQLDTPDENLPN